MHMPLRGHPVKQMQILQIFPTVNYIYGMNKYSKFEKSLHFSSHPSKESRPDIIDLSLDFPC